MAKVQYLYEMFDIFVSSAKNNISLKLLLSISCISFSLKMCQVTENINTHPKGAKLQWKSMNQTWNFQTDPKGERGGLGERKVQSHGGGMDIC